MTIVAVGSTRLYNQAPSFREAQNIAATPFDVSKIPLMFFYFWLLHIVFDLWIEHLNTVSR